MTASIDSPRFEAELGSAGDPRGTVFVSGSLDGYEIEGLRSKAMYGIKSLHIRLIGENCTEARALLEGRLAGLAHRGVEISFGAD